jgi:putative AlgH/UPF0301 family transcriptional regulator
LLIFNAVTARGPPMPYLPLIALLVMGSRSRGLLAAALLLAGVALAALHVGGLRLVMSVGDGDGRLGVEFVRRGGGAPVAGLGAGALLVASEELRHSLVFRRSVVLLTEHSAAEGARGVVLTQPMRAPPELPAAAGGPGGDAATNKAEAKVNRTWGRARGGGAAAAAPRHFLGGPVGMPGEGVRQEMLVLHTVDGVQGALALLPGVFQGGALPEVLQRSGSGGGRGGGGPAPVHLYHGVATWAPGQLEGELRAGSWAFAAASREDVFASPPEELWAGLAGGERLTWPAE